MPANPPPTTAAAVAYLEATGAHVAYNRRRCPSLTTDDGRGWEPKLARGGVVVFSPDQLAELRAFPGESFVLVFDPARGTGGITDPAIIAVPGIKVPGSWAGYRFHLADYPIVRLNLGDLAAADILDFGKSAEGRGLSQADYLRRLVDFDRRITKLIADGADDWRGWLIRERREAGL